MFTARQAKINTDAVKEQWKKDSWACISSCLENCIKRAEYSTRLILTSDEVKKLLELGYTVQHIGSNNSATWNIIWE